MTKTLNSNNYQVTTEEGHFYLTDGLRSLYRFCKNNGLNFRALCIDLYCKKSLTLNDFEIVVI